MPPFRALPSALFLGVLLTACGSAASPEESPETTPAEHGSYAHCLTEHGIEQPPGPALGPAPGPAAAPAGVDPGAWEQAMQACAEFAPGPG